MNINQLNEKDKRAYAFIRNRLVHGEQPTLREINNITKKASPRSAVLLLERLESAGLIRRIGRKFRLVSQSLEPNYSVSVIAVPLVGQVAAGAPLLAEQNVETTIDISTALAKKGSKYFLLRVHGTSMNEAKIKGQFIKDGSIILVRQQQSAEKGQIVVALVNDEATVKYFEPQGGLVVLKPKSSEAHHKSIVLTENCLIQGVVEAVLPPDLIN